MSDRSEALAALDEQIARAIDDEDVDEEDFDALLHRRNQLEAEHTRVAKLPLAKQAAALRRQADALQGDAGELSAQEAAERRAEAQELRDRADVMDARAPYQGLSTEELERRSADLEIRYEELTREQKEWADSPAKLARLKEQAEAAVLDKVRLGKEIGRRASMDDARRSMAAFAEGEAQRAAAEEWRAEWKGEVERLEAFYPGPGLVLPGAPDRWEIERAKEMLAKPPPAELVAKHRSRIMSEQAADLERYEYVGEQRSGPRITPLEQS